MGSNLTIWVLATSRGLGLHHPQRWLPRYPPWPKIVVPHVPSEAAEEFTQVVA
jgi:hypothetical protein